jgi:outer membrane protein insertion porin family
LKPADHLQTQKIRDGMLAMATLYADSGYLSAAVAPEVSVDSNIHVASLRFRIREGIQYTIASISIQGLSWTDENVVERELRFHEGDVVNYSDLLESQRQLYLTGLFESVFVRPDSAADSTKKIIAVELKEKIAGEFNVGVSYGTIEKVKGKVQVQNTNVAGTGRQLGTTLYGSFIQQKIELSFTEPWTFRTRWRTDLVGFYDLEQQPAFDLRQYGSTLTVGHVIGRRSNVSLAYRYEDSRLSNVKTPEAVPQDYDPKVRSLTGTYKIDDRDNPFNTLSGTFTELNSQLAGAFLKGTNTFVRITGRFKYFYSLDAETVIGTAFEAGWMKAFGSSTDVPLSERFYAGGPNALRSFDYQRIGPLDTGGNPLGGTVRLVWNIAEVRRAIYKFVGAVGFIDIGQVWGNQADVKLKDIRISVGPGLRINTPLGMARLDYGFNFFPRAGEASGKFYFAMGQAF